MKRALFTGASSFTGFYFVRALQERGYEVITPLKGSFEAYGGEREKRVSLLSQPVFSSPFGSDRFLQVIEEKGPFSLFCHHAAEVTDYKSDGFDFYSALQNNTYQAGRVCEALQNKGSPSIIVTGSVFEANEGQGTFPLRAFSPYALSKGLSYEVFCFFAEKQRLQLSKFVIANPFGPGEDKGLTKYLVDSWRKREVAVIKTPEYIRDHVPVSLLAEAYAYFAENGGGKLSPSYYPESVGNFVARMAREFRKRTSLPCDYILEKQKDFQEPLERINTTNIGDLPLDWDLERFWREYAARLS